MNASGVRVDDVDDVNNKRWKYSYERRISAKLDVLKFNSLKYHPVQQFLQ